MKALLERYVKVMKKYWLDLTLMFFIFGIVLYYTIY